MTKPQISKKYAVISAMRLYNNTADCDVIQDAIDQIELAQDTEELVNAILYGAKAVSYRGDFKLGTTIAEVAKQIESYESLLKAIENKNADAIAWFEKQTSFRIM